jgi:tetratricopeptide (TPR) repeat protein
MNRNDPRLQTLFAAAAELGSAEERARFLDRECPDPELRQQLESLLTAHDKPDSLFGQETVHVQAPVTETVGAMVGRYKLLERLGEGGFGAVWLAEQKEPVRRKVALKVIKLGMDTRQVVARFEAERQALALMDHPNIAKVLDAGTTDSGRPYFVMELVRGVPITKFCDENKLATRERLDLFIKVCHAVQHAHQKGIIHRDLKPSNVLVTLHDGVPVPKVIDFGIAKATQQELTDKTIHTLFQQFIGTPAYVSPEQAEMSGLDIDTRSDIYSLGVLLYELLTGVTPFDSKALLASGLDEMRRTIREQEPLRPSTRLTQHQAQAKAQISDRKSQIPSDLDWIVMKCLEKDRTRRYETANGLAADLKRHLNNEPVIARPPSKLYEFQKTVRRHKFGFAATAAVMIALAVGFAISASQAVRARKAETAIRDQLEETRAALEFIRDDLLGLASPYRQPDPNLTVRKQLDLANAALQQRTALSPKLEAAFRQIMGSVYFGVGEYARATELLERALELERRDLGADHEETLRTMHILAETCWWSGDDERMLELASDGLALSRNRLGETNLITLQFLADEAAARVYGETGTTEETERLLTNALRVTSITLGDTHQMAFWLRILLAHHYNWRGQYHKVEGVLAGAIDREGVVLPPTHPLMLIARGTLARAYAEDTNRLAEAANLFRQFLAERQFVLGADHPMTVNVEIILAIIALKSKDFAQVDAIHQRLLKLLADGHLVDTRLAVRGLCTLAGNYRLNKQWTRIDELAQAALAAGTKQFGEKSIKLVNMEDEWARSFMERGRYAEAETLYEKVVDVREKHAKHGRLFNARNRLGYCLFKQGKLDRAEGLLKGGCQELELYLPQMADHLRLEIFGGALRRLIEFYEGTGQAARAEPFRNKLNDLEKKEGRSLPPGDYIVPL